MFVAQLRAKYHVSSFQEKHEALLDVAAKLQMVRHEYINNLRPYVQGILVAHAMEERGAEDDED